MFLLSYCLYGQRQKNVFGKGISHGQSSGQLGALTKTSGPSLCSAECPSLSKISLIYIWSWTLAEEIQLRQRISRSNWASLLQESSLLSGVSLHWSFGWTVKEFTGTKRQGYSKERKYEKEQEDKGENKHLILLLWPHFLSWPLR